MAGIGGVNLETPNLDFGRTYQYYSTTQERGLNNTKEVVIDRSSSIGGKSNPLGNTAATLFYQGAKNSANNNKYDKFLFYGLNKTPEGEGNNILESYYLSESRAYNSQVSSYESKNPTAKQLVSLAGEDSPIIGGSACPYNWSDFLYCKYYGRIPNNYMVTLRRYPTPMLDNLSMPNSVRDTDLHELEGAGKPVAQAITWFGGNTGNSLNDIISFSTGIKWKSVSQENILTQKGMDKGFSKSTIGRLLTTITDTATGSPAISEAIKTVVELASVSTGEGEQEITDARAGFILRERDSLPNGPLSEFRWNSVDSIDKTYIRDTGLSFADADIDLKFHYELTSVGQVNTKAAFMDLLANLLAIGTNYGVFMRPDMRFDNDFPAIGFPGGEDGLRAFFASPATFLMTYLNMVSPEEANSAIAKLKNISDDGDSAVTSDKNDQVLIKSIGDYKSNPNDKEAIDTMDRALKALVQRDFIEAYEINMSYYTGAPVGEWHLVVGNPFNPIAMIGNLICENVKIEFGEKLGPDDFPTELSATFTLKHGRDREKGEIESMFNRGRGRFYQTSIKTSASAMSVAAVDKDGNLLSEKSAVQQFDKWRSGSGQ